MDPLRASVDVSDSSRIVFSHPVTRDEARLYLWRQPPSPDALRADPTERPTGGRQRHFLVKRGDLDLVLSLQHGLSAEYLKRIKPITSTAKPEELLSWSQLR
jgi:hypothetical protein